MKHLSNIHIALLAGTLIGVFALFGPACATEIGSVTAANKRIDGTPPGQASRVLELGNRIFADEVVVTSDIGSGQFVFLDQTTLSVSPGSEIVLDRYVFDPDSGSGEVVLTMTKGVLRFIGGKVTKTGEAVVQTPHATVGIRGGIAAITVGDEGTNAVFLAGTNMCVTGQSRTICISRPGGMATVKAGSRGDRGGGDTKRDTSASGETAAGATDTESPLVSDADLGEAMSGSGDENLTDPSNSTYGETDAGIPEAPGSNLGEPIYVGVASAEDIGLIFSATDTGGDGGTTQLMDPEVVANVSENAGLPAVGAEAPSAPAQPPLSTGGDEEQPQAADSESETETIADARSAPEASTATNSLEVIVEDYMGGIKSDISALGTSGEAMFMGTATATVSETGVNGTVDSQQTGYYQMTYDFGSREGAATITGIADTIFVSTITEANAAVDEHFGGILRDAGNFAEVGSLSGSFFTNVDDTSAAAAGTFDFSRDLGGGVVQTGVGDFQSEKLN